MYPLNISRNQGISVWFYKGLTIFIFLVLATRIADLMIIKGKYFSGLAYGNRAREVTIAARRGNVLASGGEVIAGSREVKKKIVFDPGEGAWEKIPVGEGGGEEITEWQREYPYGPEFSHVLGYLGEVSGDELGKIDAKCPNKGIAGLKALRGRGGVEEEYDCVLKGYDGREMIEVDASGRRVRTLGRENSRTGEDVRTTLDFGLQKLSSELLKDKKGSIVVLGKNGEVLALFSSPAFNPNVFVERSSGEVSLLLTDPSLPLINRAISGVYHPGSVFKPIVALAALEEGKIDRNYYYEDTGKIEVNSIYGNFSFSNWYYLQYGRTEGKVDLGKAISRSTDTFFYKVGELTGIENIAKWSRIFGLDDRTGVDLPGEVDGLVPDPRWKEETLGERWFLGNTYNLSIGQGDLLVTPIEITTAVEAIANDGKLCKPYVVNAEDSVGCIDVGVKKENVGFVKEGMTGACSSGGTGYTFFDFKEKYGIDVACKTGTAQNVNKDPHSWFVAFSPLVNPEIIVTVLVEEGGEGSKVAGPIAREIFDYWFTGRQKP